MTSANVPQLTISETQLREVEKTQLTHGGHICILRVEHEEVDCDLLTGALEGQLLVEVRHWTAMLNVLQGNDTMSRKGEKVSHFWHQDRGASDELPYSFHWEILLVRTFPARSLGSSLFFRAPGPTLGSTVWNTEILPPLGPWKQNTFQSPNVHACKSIRCLWMLRHCLFVNPFEIWHFALV